MLNTLKTRKREEGFTIIEVLIVLAIAGLILLVVFLAVPALQRNQRNTARRSEAGRLSAAAQDQLTNSNGNLPTAAADANSIVNASGLTSKSNLALNITGNRIGSGGTVSGYAPKCAGSGTPLAYSDVNNDQLTICTQQGAGTFTPPTTNNDAAVLVEKAQCGTTGNAIATGTNRQMALLYTVEAGTGRNFACINVQ